ncbi:MAG: type II toxin-antitoxin system RelE/ParE family toxin [Cyclobacteriaceae bacterium]
MKATKKVVWSDKAIQSLRSIYDFISEDSKPAADKVVEELLRATSQLTNHPEKFQLDEFYPIENQTVRRFFRWSYRVVYEINIDSINILNIIHTSQEPNVDK